MFGRKRIEELEEILERQLKRAERAEQYLREQAEHYQKYFCTQKSACLEFKEKKLEQYKPQELLLAAARAISRKKGFPENVQLATLCYEISRIAERTDGIS